MAKEIKRKYLVDIKDFNKIVGLSQDNKLSIKQCYLQNAKNLVIRLRLQNSINEEKAFIKILNSKYNAQKYENYPKGKDGLYNQGFDGYGYLLGEPLTLITNDAQIKGDVEEPSFYSKADSIIINGDEVKLFKSNN